MSNENKPKRIKKPRESVEAERVTFARLMEQRGAREIAVDALVSAAQTASRSFYDGVKKEMVTEPDWKTRASAAADILAYTEGKPVERKEVINVNVDSVQELERRAALSPSLRRSLEKIVEGLPKEKLQKGVEIPTEAETSESDVTKTDQLL